VTLVDGQWARLFFQKGSSMGLMNFRKKALIGFFVSTLMVFLNGCVYLVVGSVGALGGYVISPDTVEGVMYDRQQPQVWDAVLRVVSVKGVILEQNDLGGVVIAKINNAKVTITVVDIGDETVKLTIKARKALLPKVKLAQEIYVKIEASLET
jgi:hypothetical protein